MTDVEWLVAAIRETIETQLEHLMDEHDRHEGVILLPNEGTSIDTNALARAVHAEVVAHWHTAEALADPELAALLAADTDEDHGPVPAPGTA